MRSSVNSCRHPSRRSAPWGRAAAIGVALLVMAGSVVGQTTAASAVTSLESTDNLDPVDGDPAVVAPVSAPEPGEPVHPGERTEHADATGADAGADNDQPTPDPAETSPPLSPAPPTASLPATVTTPVQLPTALPTPPPQGAWEPQGAQEPQADPIPRTAQLPAEFARQAAIVAAERAAASAAERMAAAERASAARTTRLLAALSEYELAVTEVETATRVDADARADYDTRSRQSVLVNQLADSAAHAAKSSQAALSALVRSLAQGESGTAAVEALLDGAPGANLLYRLGALDRLDSLTGNIDTVRERVLADRQRSDELAAQAATLTTTLESVRQATVTAAAHLVDATATATASRGRLLALGSELSMSASLFVGSGVTVESLLAAADAGVLSEQGWARPAAGRITSGYGPRPDRPLPGVGLVHYGTDLGADCGAGVYAATSGIVAAVGDVGGYGNWVLIDHGEAIATGYAHLAAGSTRVAVGDQVEAGQVIAAIGSTGASTGCHLHFEVRLGGLRVDAVPFLESRGIRLADSSVSPQTGGEQPPTRSNQDIN